MAAIREHLFHKQAGADRFFRWRGGAVSRIEGLSDGVFALTVTLLVISVDVPDTFHELWRTVVDLPVFLVCFAMLLLAWQYHYSFFRRYGLEDGPTAALNGAFLFVVLFYAYPLKFLATMLWRLCLGESVQPMFVGPAGVAEFGPLFQRTAMMVFYGLGVAGMFGLLALMVAWAYHRRAELELDELEVFLTRASIVSHSISVAIALVSIAIAVLAGNPPLAGLIYFAMGPAHAAWGVWTGRRAERIHGRMALESGTES